MALALRSRLLLQAVRPAVASVGIRAAATVAGQDAVPRKASKGMKSEKSGDKAASGGGKASLSTPKAALRGKGKAFADSSASLLAKLRARTAGAPAPMTTGIPDDLLERFADDRLLNTALVEAHATVDQLVKRYGAAVTGTGEAALMTQLQEGFVNFYDPGALMPYVPVGARGPWVVTLHGAVVHDNGGYGMLGFGHSPDFLMPAASKPHCMANIMTPAFSQMEFVNEFRKQVGFSRKDGCPYKKVMALNSGSECVELSARITDAHAKAMTSAGGPHAGRRSTMIVLEGSFYGRTYRPARLSHSCREIYQKHLASFQHEECHLPMLVKPNDVSSLRAAFAEAEARNLHVEALYMEPVMGEGNPGEVLTREFYGVARELATKAHSLLVIDSIQAGLRTKGALSISDYPGFADAPAPDMETFSKALNAGQVPLSVLALSPEAASRYVVGLYGNTMTGNPRALDVGAEVLRAVTPAVRANIVSRGDEMHTKFGGLAKKYPKLLTKVTGSGLLQAIHLRPEIPMFGGNEITSKSFLAACRRGGVGIINAAHTVKFTSHFELTSKEIDLLVDAMDRVCAGYSRQWSL